MSNIQDLQEWVACQLAVTAGEMQWQPLSGDASFRRYFRCVVANNSYLVALAPPATEKNREFVSISRMLQSANVRASHVIAVNFEQGFILQNDFGDLLLRSMLTNGAVDIWYDKAMQQLQQMLVISPEQLVQLPVYDTSALFLELSYFKTWFLEAMLDYTCTAEEELMLQQFFDDLIESALAQPQVFVHRDYHSRNIMITADDQLAAIDFQDAVCGPITYDLVSLLRDCYVVWPDDQVRGWVKHYWQQLYAGHIIDVQESVFQRWFDLMGLQRHIKVLGIFARLSIRDSKHGYLNDLPTVVNYVRSVAADEFIAEDFLAWFDKKIMPLVKQQKWSQRQ